VRLDKWLWFARFFKTRSLAQAAIEAGTVRLNGRPVDKTARGVAIDDEMIFPTGRKWRRVRVLALGERRGPAPEARALYVELDPPPVPDGG